MRCTLDIDRRGVVDRLVATVYCKDAREARCRYPCTNDCTAGQHHGSNGEAMASYGGHQEGIGAWGNDGSTCGQGIRRGTGGGRHYEPVCPIRVQAHSVRVHVDGDQPRIGGSCEDHVIQGPRVGSGIFTNPNGEDEALFNGIGPRFELADSFRDLRNIDLRQESQAPQVDAQNGRIAAGDAVRRAEERTVSAKGQHQVRSGRRGLQQGCHYQSSFPQPRCNISGKTVIQSFTVQPRHQSGDRLPDRLNTFIAGYAVGHRSPRMHRPKTYLAARCSRQRSPVLRTRGSAENMPEHVVIVGNGITGITAARFIRKLSPARITVISGETDHHYARTALMYVYMGHMRYRDTKPYEDGFWDKNDIDLVRGYATSIDTAGKQVRMAGGSTIRYDKLLLATGSKPNMFGWPGQDLDGVQGLYGMPDLDSMERWTRDTSHAVVVGGGLIGIEMAEMLHTRHIPVTFLVREKGYMDYLLPAEECAIIGREIYDHDIDLRLGTELDSILPDANGRCRAVVTSRGEEVPCQFVGLTAGVHPNTDLAQASGIATNRGIVVNECFESSIPDVYAAGDCAEFDRDGIGSRRIEQLWYTGRLHGKTVARSICGLRTPYDRGVFFNSAKFFTVEYQTYGTILAERPPRVQTVVWQDATRKKLLRIDYEADGGAVRGFNALGTRLRQDMCEHWILQKATIGQVLGELRRAHFDGEFGRKHVRSLKRSYQQTGHSYA